jgi:hypothetical protein
MDSRFGPAGKEDIKELRFYSFSGVSFSPSGSAGTNIDGAKSFE